MTDVFLSVWAEYVRFELLPVYLGTVPIWVLTSSVRGVAWSLVKQAWMVVNMNSSLGFEFVSRYQEVLRDPKLNRLRGPSYVFALWNAFFAVPMQVLEEGGAEYRHYGIMLRSWWTALLVTFGDYLPGLSVRSGRAYLAYIKATCEAWTTVWLRTVAVVKGLCWFMLLCLSLAIHFPMALFDIIEFMAFGSTGLAVVLAVVNLLNYVSGWTPWLGHATFAVVVVGIVTHVWRFGDDQGRLQDAAPSAVVSRALQSARCKVNECNRREAAWLASLRGSEPTSTTRRRYSRHYTTGELTSAQVPLNIQEPLSSPAPTVTPTYSTTAPTAAPSTTTPSPADYFTLSLEELHVVKCLRNMERDRVGRGRPTSGPGVCPVPGNTASEPATPSGAHYVPGPCLTSDTVWAPTPAEPPQSSSHFYGYVA